MLAVSWFLCKSRFGQLQECAIRVQGEERRIQVDCHLLDLWHSPAGRLRIARWPKVKSGQLQAPFHHFVALGQLDGKQYQV